MTSVLWACAKAQTGMEQPPSLPVHPSACTRTQHHAVPGSGKAARNPAHENKAALLALAWKKNIGFWGYNITLTDSALIACIACSLFVIVQWYFFPGCCLDEIYIRSWKKCRFISFCRQLLSCITGCTGWKAGKFWVLDCTNSVFWQLRRGPSHFTKRLVIKAEQSQSKGRMYSKWHCSRDVTIWKM